MPSLSRSVALLRRALADSWQSLLACPGDDFTRTVDDHRGALSHLDDSADVSARDTIDAIAIDLGVALSDLRRDLRDGREDEHADHGVDRVDLDALALRRAAAAMRRTGASR